MTEALDRDDVNDQAHQLTCKCTPHQAVQSASGIAVGQKLVNGSRGSPGSSNLEAVQHYAGMAAKTSGKHIKSFGEAGYKYFTSQVASGCSKSHSQKNHLTNATTSNPLGDWTSQDASRQEEGIVIGGYREMR